MAITLESSFEEDCEQFIPKFICSNKTEFEAAIKEILSSEQVLKVIQMLYSKAVFQSSNVGNLRYY